MNLVYEPSAPDTEHPTLGILILLLIATSSLLKCSLLFPYFLLKFVGSSQQSAARCKRVLCLFAAGASQQGAASEAPHASGRGGGGPAPTSSTGTSAADVAPADGGCTTTSTAGTGTSSQEGANNSTAGAGTMAGAGTATSGPAQNQTPGLMRVLYPVVMPLIQQAVASGLQYLAMSSQPPLAAGHFPPGMRVPQPQAPAGGQVPQSQPSQATQGAAPGAQASVGSQQGSPAPEGFPGIQGIMEAVLSAFNVPPGAGPPPSLGNAFTVSLMAFFVYPFLCRFYVPLLVSYCICVTLLLRLCSCDFPCPVISLVEKTLNAV
jgi:hypothetical protein